MGWELWTGDALWVRRWRFLGSEESHLGHEQQILSDDRSEGCQIASWGAQVPSAYILRRGSGKRRFTGRRKGSVGCWITVWGHPVDRWGEGETSALLFTWIRLYNSSPMC